MKVKPIPILTLVICVIALNALAQSSGEIVFADQTIEPASPAGLKDSFTVGDHIYAVAYFDKSLRGIVGKESAKKVTVEIFLYELKAPLYDCQQPSEVQLETGSLAISGNALNVKYLPVDIIPSANETTAYGNPDFVYKKFGDQFAGPVKYSARLSQLEPGEHKIIVKVRCNYDFVAEGSFTLSGDDYTLLNKTSQELNAAATGLKTKDTVMPKAAMSDQALENEMKAAFVGSQTYKDRINGEVLRIVIIDPDWMIRRHEISGAILHRYIRADIAVKNSDGSCTRWQLVTFQQDYIGDAFQPTKFDGVGDPLPIPCANVSK